MLIFSFFACTRVSVAPPAEKKTSPRLDQSQDKPFGDDFISALKFSGSVEVEVFKILDSQFKQTQKIPSQLMILSQLLDPVGKTKDIFYNCLKVHWAQKSEQEIEVLRTCEKQPQVIANIKKESVNNYRVSFIQSEWQTVIGDSALLNQKDKVCKIVLSDRKVQQLSCDDTLITVGTGEALEEIRITQYKFDRQGENQIVLTGGRYKDYLERKKIDITVPEEGKIKVHEIEMAVRDDFAARQEKQKEDKHVTEENARPDSR